MSMQNVQAVSTRVLQDQKLSYMLTNSCSERIKIFFRSYFRSARKNKLNSLDVLRLKKYETEH